MSEAAGVGMMAGIDSGDKIVLGLGVADVSASMQRFGWADYIVFVLTLFVCIIVGIYFGFYQKSSTSQAYLIGGRKMQTIPIALSLIASYISGISLLGIPTEIYVYGIQYLYILGGAVIMGWIADKIYLPVFHNLKLTSTYEYLELRFDKRMRLFGSILFTINLLVWLPIVIYVPALAFNQVTGVNVHLITPMVCLICIFYTSMGGIKAVVWTDVIQTVLMLGAMLLVMVKGTINVGGFHTVWERNLNSHRIEAPNFDLNPLSRHTVWSLVVGGTFYLLSSILTQSMIQRFLALPSPKAASRAIWSFVFGLFVVLILCSYSGLLLYATYHTCDPLSTMLAREKDQLLPILVMDVLGEIPGLPGLFVAGVFSAALSSLSTGLNSMAAIVLEDFYKTLFDKDITEYQSQILMKLTVVIVGAICVGLVFLVEKLGAVLQLTISIGAIASGPSLALITMGILIPWINATGALVGGISGLVFMSWLCLKTQAAIAIGDITFPEKPVSTDGCHYHFTPKSASGLEKGSVHLDASLDITEVIHTDETMMIYRLSYLWYVLIGMIVSIAVGVLTSFITKPNDPRDIDPRLLAKFIRKFIKPREFPNQPPNDEIIYAYERPNVKINQAAKGKTEEISGAPQNI